MNIQENISLKSYNTFGIDKKARFLVKAHHSLDVKSAIAKSRDLGIPLLVLGGGSNILLTQDLEAFVLKMEIKGLSVFNENDDEVIVKVGEGENWHNFVLHCISNGWAGVENLSLIPGTVGASPMQNIGAYGIEIQSVFYQLIAIDRKTSEERIFTFQDCKFGYRDSIFKSELKDQFIITHVFFRLQKKPVFHISYGAIQSTLEEMGIKQISIQAISEAVIKIRQSKLPDPKVTGNAGSFFKNPTVAIEVYNNLKAEYPEIPSFPNEEGMKIPAAWLIEQTGWKGKKIGNIGVHPLQPLVLVNYGGGDGMEIKQLSEKIQETVFDKFGIKLHPEVNFL